MRRKTKRKFQKISHIYFFKFVFILISGLIDLSVVSFIVNFYRPIKKTLLYLQVNVGAAASSGRWWLRCVDFKASQVTLQLETHRQPGLVISIIPVEASSPDQRRRRRHPRESTTTRIVHRRHSALPNSLSWTTSPSN